MFPQIYDHATNLLHLDATAKDSFPDGSPLGITIHYTADGTVQSAVKALIAKDYGYHILIDRDGSVWQMTSFNKTCSHAGKALWLGRSPNHHHIAVALVSWGFLTKEFKTYTGLIIPSTEVANRPDNLAGRIQPWHKATDAQLAALARFLSWSIAHGIDLNQICGHDECAIPEGRKFDPGGVLPMSMSDLRKTLRGDRVA